MRLEINHKRDIIIGVVTVLFNSEDVLPGFFESLTRQEGISFRLYVIDNSAHQRGYILSEQLVKQHNIDATLIYNNENAGVAKGNNQGIELALLDGCEYVLLANNDVEFRAPRLLFDLQQSLIGTAFSAITPKIYYFGTNKIWFAGGRFSKITGINRHIGDQETDVGQYDHQREFDYAPTCFVLFKTTVFQSIGLMDEKYFVYFDDADFLWRMKTADLKLAFLSSCVVEHKVSFSTGGNEGDFSLYYLNRNRLYFIRKHSAGIFLWLHLFIYFSTRVLKYLSLSSRQRQALIRGIRDGIFLK